MAYIPSSTLQTLDKQVTQNNPASPLSITITKNTTILRVTNIGDALTIDLSGGTEGDTLIIYLQNDATSGRVITWGTGILSAAPTTTLTVSKETVVTFRHNGTNFLLTHISTPL